MECPVCKNTRGFVCGTCVQCGYNYLDNTFHFIEVRTELLEQLVSPEAMASLIAEHVRTYEG